MASDASEYKETKNEPIAKPMHKIIIVGKYAWEIVYL